MQAGQGISNTHQTQQLCVRSQRTGARLNRLICELIIMSLPRRCFTPEAFLAGMRDSNHSRSNLFVIKKLEGANAIHINTPALLEQHSYAP